jgi:hypothetical protein
MLIAGFVNIRRGFKIFTAASPERSDTRFSNPLVFQDTPLSFRGKISLAGFPGIQEIPGKILSLF